MPSKVIKTVKCWRGGIKSFLKEHKALPILLVLVVGLTFGLSRLVLANTVTVKYIDKDSYMKSLTLNKGSNIYLDPNFGYFKKDNSKRIKKLTLTSDLDLTNNDDISINSYAVAKIKDPKINILNNESTYGKNTTFSSIRTMQEMSSTICANETTPTKEAVNTTTTHSTNTNLVPEARLKDTRDNKYYTVRKLADGNCWMTDNLAYAKAGTLKPEDSDVQDTSFSIASSDIYTKDGEKWKDEDNKKFIYDRREISYNSTTKNNTSFPLKGWSKTRLGNSNISLEAIYYKTKLYGNLYTWHTVTAGSGTYDMDNKGDNATSSICPRGWKLPQNDGTNSYKNLLFTSYGLQKYNEDSSTKMRSSPLDLSFTGGYSYIGGVYYVTDINGSYWSSTVHSSDDAYNLNFLSSYVNPQDWDNKANGRSVRCVAL